MESGLHVSSEAVVRRVFWVEWFHKVPHINLTLHTVNSTFDPFSQVYQESLGIIGSVPAGLLILTLLSLLLYLLTRCCDNRPRKAGSITCLKATCVIAAIFTLGSLGVSVWGNEEVHNGIKESIYSLGTINNKVQSLSNKTRLFDETVERNLEPELNLFKETVDNTHIKNTTAKLIILDRLHYIKLNISEVLLINVEDIRAKLNRANLTYIVDLLGLCEMARWVATLVLTALLMMVVLVVPLGVARHSRATLITFSVLGLVSLILCWGLTSLYLVSNVAISDWCVNPAPFMETQLGPLVSHDVASYYLRCEPTLQSPFTRYLKHAHQAADVIDASMDKVTAVADDIYPAVEIHPRLDRVSNFVKQSQRMLGDIAAHLECQKINPDVIQMVNAICYQAVSGFVYLLISSAGSGFFFTILVWFTSHTWIYLNNKSDQVNWSSDPNHIPMERHMRAPQGQPHPHQHPHPQHPHQQQASGHQQNSHSRPPRHSHTPPQTPPFPGTLNGHSFHRDGMHMSASHSHGSLGPPTVTAPPSASNTGLRGGSKNQQQNNNSQKGNHHHHSHASTAYLAPGPNAGQYATLSKQCKTLESSDFY